MDLDKLVLESKYPQFQFCMKGPISTQWEDGLPVQRAKHLVLFFDRYLCLLEDMIGNQEWTEEDQVYAQRAIDKELKNPSTTDMWIHEAPKVNPPWPAYDTTHHNQIATIASSVGLLTEALTYEERGREGGPRESVVKKLRELLEEGPATIPDLEDDLAAV